MIRRQKLKLIYVYHMVLGFLTTNWTIRFKISLVHNHFLCLNTVLQKWNGCSCILQLKPTWTQPLYFLTIFAKLGCFLNKSLLFQANFSGQVGQVTPTNTLKLLSQKVISNDKWHIESKDFGLLNLLWY